MIQLAANYRKPLIIAVSLHIILFVLFFIHFSSPHAYQSPSSNNTVIIKAHAVDGHQLDLQLKAQRVRKLRIQQAKRAAKLRAIRQRRAQQKRLQMAKAARLKEARLTQLKARQKKLAMTQHKLQKQLRMAQLQQESRAVAQQQSRQLQLMVDKYKGLILEAIAANWLIPMGVSPHLTCRFLVQLAPGGLVLSVRLVKTSGNTALDQSARAAILKTSPLPVPDNPALFKRFRQLSLTVSPKRIKTQDQ